MYMFEGLCVSKCPDPDVVNLNFTLCITKEQYSEEYSKESKPLYFPFTIAGVVVVAIGVGLKCYAKNMHLVTLLVSAISLV
jgi:hypothetical protein